jgi:integral membrane sensor domain MASE1
LVRDASEQVSALVRAEIELAKAELGETVRRGGIGAALFGAAVVVALLSLPFLFVTLAEVLVAVGLPRWSSYLIVWGVFALLAVLLAVLGRRAVRRLRRPERTLETVKDTARWARHPTAKAPSDGGH